MTNLAAPPHSLRLQRRERKSPRLYYIILSLWVVLYGIGLYSILPVVRDAFARGALLGTMVAITVVFIGYFWLNGTKDVVYTFFYHLWMKHRFTLPPVCRLYRQPRVVMVYCTYNDFNEKSLLESMRQDYDNFMVVILDDSTDPEFKRQIDIFGHLYKVPVIRRQDHAGFKAGNLNNFLMREGYDYFVILDSDEITPRNFIRRSLDYFAADDRVGIVQATHIASRNRNAFMKKFARGVDSHWPVYQTVKNHYGFLSLLGHGAMVSRRCYAAAGGFPHVVAEDICFTMAARDAGYLTTFAPDIVCEEEYPVDFTAFTKRHNKWTQGNMEFIRKNTGRIIRSDMRWFEKLDIVLFTYSLPLTALFSIYMVINVAVFPLMDYTLEYPLWWLVPTVAFLVAPMLNDIVFYWKKISKFELASYLLHSTLLYGSMYYTSLRASVKSAFGKSTFIVTPKQSDAIGFWQTIYLNRGTLLFAVVLAMVSLLAQKSILPVLLLFTPAVYVVYLTVMHMRLRVGQRRR